MKIDDYSPGRISPYQNTISQDGDEVKSRESRTLNGNQQSGDKVELSQTSKEIARVKAVVEAAEPVRQEKVEAMRAKLSNGSYQVPAEETADKMLKESLQELI